MRGLRGLAINRIALKVTRSIANHKFCSTFENKNKGPIALWMSKAPSVDGVVSSVFLLFALSFFLRFAPSFSGVGLSR